MNTKISIQFLALLLLSIGSTRIYCWDVPSTDIPPNVAGEIPGMVTGDGSGAQGEDRGQVLETHHTTCQITTEELVATAQATATRVLTGLCNSREMENRFKSLEAQIADLLNALKLMIVDLENKLTLQNGELPTQHSLANIPLQNEDETFRCVEPHCSTPFTESVRFYPQETVEKLDQGKWIDEVDDSTAFITDTEWPREDEISRLNNTVHMEPYPESPLKNTASPVHRVFTYYWRMHGIASKINSWDSRRSLRSPSFYITPNGYRMYLLVFPRQNYENFYVHVGITVGANDANLSWPFSLKHRIQLLDQVRTPSSKKKRPLIQTRPILPQDLASRVWNPALLCSASVWRRPLLGDSTECVGLGYPHEMLKSRNYIYNDSVVIKLTVYLE